MKRHHIHTDRHSITTVFWRLFSVLFLTSLFTSISATAGAMAMDSEAQRLQQELNFKTSELVNLLKQNQAKYQQDSLLFQRDLDLHLGQVIDFKRIALKIMGRYGRKATKSQRRAFLNVFKQSLYATYGKTLLTAGNIDMVVKSVELNSRHRDRAKAAVVLNSGSENAIPIYYAIRKNKLGQWKIENIVVMGVNVGLAYRDRFASEIKQYHGNIQAVIDHWNQAENSAQHAELDVAIAR